MIREPKVELLPEEQADFPFSVSFEPWFLVLLVVMGLAIAGAVWRLRRR